MVDRTVNPAAGPVPGVCSMHDGVNMLLGDVATRQGYTRQADREFYVSVLRAGRVEQQSARVVGVMMDRLVSRQPASAVAKRLARVRIRIEAGIVRRRYVDANPVTGCKVIGCWVHDDPELIDLTGCHELLSIESVAETCSDDAVTQV